MALPAPLKIFAAVLLWQLYMTAVAAVFHLKTSGTCTQKLTEVECKAIYDEAKASGKKYTWWKVWASNVPPPACYVRLEDGLLYYNPTASTVECSDGRKCLCKGKGVHPCDKDDHGCEQVCEKIKDDFKCACREGHIFGDDQKSCVKKEKVTNLFHLKTSGTCTQKLTEVECKAIYDEAKASGKKYTWWKVWASKVPPPACYVKLEDGLLYYNPVASTVECSDEMKCLCKGKGGKEIECGAIRNATCPPVIYNQTYITSPGKGYGEKSCRERCMSTVGCWVFMLRHEDKKCYLFKKGAMQGCNTTNSGTYTLYTKCMKDQMFYRGFNKFIHDNHVIMKHEIPYTISSDDANPDVVVMETSSDQSMVHPVIKSVDHNYIKYLTVSSTWRKHDYQPMHLVLKDRKKDAPTDDFQYGKVHIKDFETVARCTQVNFAKIMSSEPSVKLTIESGMKGMAQVDYLAFYTNAWIRSVSTSGFKMCYREGIAFSGRHNLTVHYIAVSKAVHVFSEVGKMELYTNKNFPSAPGDHRYCQRMFFAKKYLARPMVFATSQEGSGATDSELFSYITTINTDSVTLCARSSYDDIQYKRRQRNILVNYIVVGDVDPCGKAAKAPKNLECKVDANGKVVYGCVRDCKGRSDHKPYCAPDFRTHTSLCEERKKACERDGSSIRTNIPIAHMGKCQQFVYDSGTVQLLNSSNPTLKSVQVKLNPAMFHATRPMIILLTVNWNGVRMPVGDKTHEATAVWSDEVSSKGFRINLAIAGRHYEDHYPVPSVNWVVYQLGSSSSEILGGVVDMPAWYTGSKCAKIDLTGVYVGDTTKVMVSVEHTQADKYTDAMTAWAEVAKDGNRKVLRLCARELQNFDGHHTGIRLHWAYLKRTLAPYISEVKDITFPEKNVNGAYPAECRTVNVNTMYPSLPDPIIMLTPQPVDRSMDVINPWSPHDLAVWIESLSQTSMRVCMKSVRSTTVRVAIRVTYTVFPRLCNNDIGWEFFDGNCYYKNTNTSTRKDSAQLCESKNATLPTANSVEDAEYLAAQAGRSGESMWLQLRKNATQNGTWAWQDDVYFTHWMKGQPDESSDVSSESENKVFHLKTSGTCTQKLTEVECKAIYDEAKASGKKYTWWKVWASNVPPPACYVRLEDGLLYYNPTASTVECSDGRKCLCKGKGEKKSGESKELCAATKGGAIIGWDSVDCEEKNSAVCERDAHLEPKSCQNHNCLNGGKCIAMNDGPACNCPEGFGGNKCQTKLSELLACKKMATLDDPERSIKNNKTGEFCDTSLSGWYRFSSSAGTKILEHCPETDNVCGGKYPGWIEGDHPTVNEGEVERTLRFFRFSCTDDLVMKVGVQNCGDFLSYKFEVADTAACDLTVCNAF